MSHDLNLGVTRAFPLQALMIDRLEELGWKVVAMVDGSPGELFVLAITTETEEKATVAVFPTGELWFGAVLGPIGFCRTVNTCLDQCKQIAKKANQGGA